MRMRGPHNSCNVQDQRHWRHSVIRFKRRDQSGWDNWNDLLRGRLLALTVSGCFVAPAGRADRTVSGISFLKKLNEYAGEEQSCGFIDGQGIDRLWLEWTTHRRIMPRQPVPVTTCWAVPVTGSKSLRTGRIGGGHQVADLFQNLQTFCCPDGRIHLFVRFLFLLNHFE